MFPLTNFYNVPVKIKDAKQLKDPAFLKDFVKQHTLLTAVSTLMELSLKDLNDLSQNEGLTPIARLYVNHCCQLRDFEEKFQSLNKMTSDMQSRNDAREKKNQHLEHDLQRISREEKKADEANRNVGNKLKEAQVKVSHVGHRIKQYGNKS